MRFRKDLLIVPGLAVLILLIDQTSKYLVRTRLEVGQSWDITPWLAPIVRVTYVTNTGAAFGLFPQWSVVFIIVAMVVIVTILVYQHRLPGGQWLTRIALGLQMGGASGNLVDRLLHRGSVVDFIDFNFWPVQEFPVSNVADISVVSGVTVLACLMLWEEWRERGEQRVIEGVNAEPPLTQNE
jgi:signal peptidase II